MTDNIIKTRSGFATRMRNYFLTGMIICAPIAITAYLSLALIRWVDGWVKPYLPKAYNPETYLPFDIPGYGVIVAGVTITLVGFLAANFVGRSIVSFGERLLDRMPIVRSVYSALKQIFQTALAEKSDSFKEAALIEYPRKGLYAVVFVATSAKGEIAETLDPMHKETIAVFLPTTPNPTSGFLLFVPKDEIMRLSMTVEEAAKLVISAGLVTPEMQRKLKAIAKEEGHDLDAGTAI